LVSVVLHLWTVENSCSQYSLYIGEFSTQCESVSLIADAENSHEMNGKNILYDFHQEKMFIFVAKY